MSNKVGHGSGLQYFAEAFERAGDSELGKEVIQFGLFELLNIADAERIHSQVIVWLLSHDSSLSTAEKSKFLTSFLGLGDKVYRSIDAITEFQNIDILIRADEDLFVIENKLKSSQHSDQLVKYVEILKDDASGFWMLKGSSPPTFYFLTLINEFADCEGWINIGYGQLMNAIQQIDHEEQHPLIRAYLTSLENLMRVVSDFNEDHRLFKSVFEDGSRTKWQKAQDIRDGKYSSAQAYIAKCQLETILQKMFMARIACHLNLEGDDTIEINETRGVALLQVRFANSSFEMGGRVFKLGIQFQGQSFKINMMARDYFESKVDWIPVDVKNEFKAVAVEHNLRFNTSRWKAYLSISKRLPRSLWEYSFDELVDYVNVEGAKARCICSDLKSRIKAIL